MTDSPPPDRPTPGEDPPELEAQLARLADGSLAPAQRDALREQVHDSPQLQARLAEQERAVALMRESEQTAAPASLRAAVQDRTDAAGARRRAGDRSRTSGRAGARGRSPLRPGALGAGALVAAAVVAVLLLVTGGRAGPTVGRTARLALAAATGPAPATAVGEPNRLAVRQSGIPFPSYVDSARWRVSGLRRDTLDGRRVTTVFYGRGAERVGYSIVSGAALPIPSGHASTVGDVRYVTRASRGLRLVTWRRDGHTCVIAGQAVSERALLALAVADEATA